MAHKENKTVNDRRCQRDAHTDRCIKKRCKTKCSHTSNEVQPY